MYIIAGLGNPGREYENTRHNIGFLCIDAIADKYNISMVEKKHKAILGRGYIGGAKVILVKPQTFMNLSGESIRAIAEYYKVMPEEDLVVIYDDVALDVGQIRIRKKGSAGGHNGMKSIIQYMGDAFVRIRMGVGEKPKGYDLADYVLGHFTKVEKALMEESADRCAKAVELVAQGEVEQAMNEYNKKVNGQV